MATIVKNRKNTKSTISQYIFKLFSQYYFWTYALEQYRSNGVMTLRFQGQLIAKIKIQRKIKSFKLKVI